MYIEQNDITKYKLYGLKLNLPYKLKYKLVLMKFFFKYYGYINLIILIENKLK